MIRTLRELWRYRELAWILVEKELKLRYRRSILDGAIEEARFTQEALSPKAFTRVRP